MGETDVLIGFKVDEQTDIDLRLAAAARRINKSELLREIVTGWRSAGKRGDIPEILTDLLDGRETFDGAVARLSALQCKAALAEAEEWSGTNDQL